MGNMLPPERLLAVIETHQEIVATALDLEAVMARVVARAPALTGADAAVLELVDGDELVYHAASGRAEPHVGLRLRAQGSLSGACVATGAIMLCRDTETDPRVNREACRRIGAGSMVCVPLCHGSSVVGVLKVYDRAAGAFDEADVELLRLLSGVIAAHIAHATDFAVQRHESRHDAMTGLANWREFDERLAAEIARARRYGQELAVCLFDLDRFKEVNDTLGHEAGNALLRAVASKLRNVRPEDSAFRLGGDEFAVILVGAGRDAGLAIARRLAAAIAEDPECHGVGVSFGVAALAECEDQARMLALADERMYGRKQSRAASR